MQSRLSENPSSHFILFSGLGRTLFSSLLLFSLLPLSVLGLLSYQSGQTSLLEKEVKSLQAAVNLRTLYLGSYFKERINDLILHADFSENIVLMQKLQAAFVNSRQSLDEFLVSYQYNNIITEHGADIQEFQELSASYHDILLIDKEGNILHSVAGESNLGTNIYSGPYKDTELAKVTRKTIELGKTLCSDLSIHESSGNRKSLFATQIMVDLEGEMIGVMVMQITIKEINSIMTDPSGLGDTGQTFLIGNDSRLRSKLRNNESTSVSAIPIDNPLISEWLIRENIRHAPDTSYEEKQNLPVVSKPTYYLGQSHKETLAISHDIDSLGIYDIHWLMIAEIDVAEAFSASRALGEVIFSILMVTAILISILAAVITRRMILPLRNITAWARKVTEGELAVENIRTQNNEIGSLYHAMSEMVGSLNKMISQKDQQDWLKSGEAGLNKSMQGVQELATLEQNILNFICDYLHLQVGAFFLLDNNVLCYTAGYAYMVNSDKKSLSYQLGEGLVGQAALQKKLIIFEQVPDNHFNILISSGLGTSLPDTLLVLPLLQEQKLIGVMELGKAGKFSEQDIQFLEQVSPVAAININTALAGQNVQRLLEKTQTQGQELQEHQKELKEYNTELKEKTDYLEKQRSEIASAKQELEEKARDLEQASKYKSEFLANISHELRSPLNSLLILAQSLAENDEGNLSPEQVYEAQIIHSGGLELLNLINDILDLSKVEAGKIDLHFEKMEFSLIAQELENQFKPLAREKNIDFSIVLATELASSMTTDEQRLKQIIKNLISNAIKFTNQGSVCLTIKPVQTKDDESTTKLMTAFIVTDTGIGIPENKYKDIFEAFQQIDGSTSRKYGGTGLGLTISSQFTKLLGGKIELESHVDKGTTFTLHVPDSEQPPSAVNHQADISPLQYSLTADTAVISDDIQGMPADEIKNNFKDKCVMIVDDDMRNSFALANLLKKSAIKVELAANGKQALDKVAKLNQLDLVLMDIMMPEMDGYEAMGKIRAQSKHSQVPIIALTAKAMSGDKQHCLDAGANDYMTKPIDISQFFKILKKWLFIDAHDNSKKNLLNQKDTEK